MKTYLKLTLFLLIFSLLLFSCRTTPENDFINNETVSARENIPSEKLVPVKINILGAEYEDQNNTSIENNNLDSYTIDLNPFTFAKVNNLIDTPKNNEQLESLGLTPYYKKGKDLPKGALVTILVYRDYGARFGFLFEDEVSFKVGDDSTIWLPMGQLRLIIVSTGTDEALKFENKKLSENLEDLKIIFEGTSNSTEFFYKTKDFYSASAASDPRIDIFLMRSTGISIILDVSELEKPKPSEEASISSVENIKLTYKRPKKITWGVDKFYSEDGYEEVSLPIHSSKIMDDPSKLRIEFYDAILIAFDESTNPNKVTNVVLFSTDITVKTKSEGENGKALKNLLIHVTPPGRKHLITIKPVTCGAYLGSYFREFMCHNLGEGYKDPFPSGKWAIDNVKDYLYAWGKRKKVNIERGNPYDLSKGIWPENPCPSGFKIPTDQEWLNVLRSNKIRNWKKVNASNILFWTIGERLYIYNSKGNNHLWTATSFYDSEDPEESIKFAYTVRFEDDNKGSSNIYYGNIMDKSRGYPVRCMKSK